MLSYPLFCISETVCSFIPSKSCVLARLEAKNVNEAKRHTTARKSDLLHSFYVVARIVYRSRMGNGLEVDFLPHKSGDSSANYCQLTNILIV